MEVTEIYCRQLLNQSKKLYFIYAKAQRRKEKNESKNIRKILRVRPKTSKKQLAILGHIINIINFRGLFEAFRRVPQEINDIYDMSMYKQYKTK